MEDSFLHSIPGVLTEGYLRGFRGLLHTLQNLSLTNSLVVLVGISLFFWAWEILRPWRTKQGVFRQDFWLDAFYMFFNLFVFPVIGFAAFSGLLHHFWTSLLGALGAGGTVLIDLGGWPGWAQILVLFLARDFTHWNVHRILHRVPLFWEFHKVHHSVEQLGFAAHLRYHWMENVLYRVPEYLVLSIFGFGVVDFFIVYTAALFIGHWNHANITLPLGPLKYILNNPQMHLWHHVRDLPEGTYGVNYGISLSLWDYLFGSVYMPRDGRDEPLGFAGLESFPKGFLGQAMYPLGRSREEAV